MEIHLFSLVFILLLQSGSACASAGEILHTVRMNIQLVMRRVDWVVEKILGRHDTVLHLDGPHVLALALPVPWSDLGVAVHGGAHVEGGVVVLVALQVVVALGGSGNMASPAET